MSEATVSIILSNFNHGHYLEQSLNAIFAQVCPADQVIVIDDGSTDNSLEIIRRYQDLYPQMDVLENGINRGLQYSIARAMGLISSRYFVWTAADDVLLPTFLEKSMAALSRHPDAGLCFSEVTQLLGDTGKIERFAENPDIAHVFNLTKLPEYLSPHDLQHQMSKDYIAIYGNSIVCRFDALLSCGGFFRALEWHSDLFAFYAVAARFGVCSVPETLALIRTQPETYSRVGMQNNLQQIGVLSALLDVLRLEEFKDIRRFFIACPSFFSPFGTLMLRVMLRRPGDYRLMLKYFLWKFREYKRGHRLSWLRVCCILPLKITHFYVDRLKAKFA